MASEKPTVVVDTREVRSGIPEKLVKLGLYVKSRMLSVGDYALAGDVLIERKTAEDLIASVYDGRLFEQASRISSISSNPLLVIENPLKDALEAASNKAAIYGALATLAFSHNFKIFHTSDGDETAHLIAVIAKHRRYRDLRYASPVVRSKPRFEKAWQRQLAMVQSIPWIGEKYARRLLKSLGTVRAVFNASPSQLTQAAGIPSATAVKIHRLINQPYKEDHSRSEQAELERSIDRPT